MLVRVLDSWSLTRVRAGSSGYSERGVEPRAAGDCGRGHSQPVRHFGQQSRGDFVCKFWSACLSSLQSLPPSRSCAMISPLHHLQVTVRFALASVLRAGIASVRRHCGAPMGVARTRRARDPPRVRCRSTVEGLHVSRRQSEGGVRIGRSTHPRP